MFKLLKDKDFLQRFFKISFPVMLHAFILFIVNFLDNIMVGSVSNEAVSGVYAASQATYILMIASYGVILGAGVFIQQFNGAKDEIRTREAFRYKIVVMLIFIALFLTVYYTLGHHLIWFYCHNDNNNLAIYNEGKKYLYVVVLSFIPYCLSMLYTTTVREIGMTKYALYAGIYAVITNVIFNSIFIYGLKMGAVGAALGTIIARIVELIAIIIMCHRRQFAFCKGVFKNFKIEKALFFKIAKKSTLFLLNELFWVFGIILLSLAYAQRDNVLSALSIVSSISNIFNIIFQGLSIGIGVLVGSYLGQSKFEEAIIYTKKVYLLGFFMALLFGIIIILLSPVIPYIFKEITIEQKTLASKLLLIYGSLLWGNAMYTCCYVTLKTGGRALTTFLLDSGLNWCVSVPMAWLLVKFTNLDLIYIYLCVLSFDIIKFIIAISIVKKGSWLRNLTELEDGEAYA